MQYAKEEYFPCHYRYGNSEPGVFFWQLKEKQPTIQSLSDLRYYTKSLCFS